MRVKKLLFTAMATLLACTLSISALATSEDLSEYSMNDIAIVNIIIDNNGIQGVLKNAPSDWEKSGLVSWGYGEDGERHVTELYLEKKQLRGTLDVSQLSELKKLDCANNELSGLLVSGLTKLETLFCYNNLLRTIDLTGLFNLKDFRCHLNSELTEITGLSDCVNLEWLLCAECDLQGTLDVTGLAKLTRLACYYNNITEIIGLPNKADMTSLEVYTNKLRQLDVSGCRKLEKLWCNNNELSIINGLTDCEVLKSFKGDRNNLTALDLSGLPNKCDLTYYNNQGFTENNCFTEVALKTGTLKIENSVGGKGYISEIVLADNKASLAAAADTGYVFAGWYTDAALTEESKVDFDGNVSGNITLYPKFSKTITPKLTLTAPVKNATPQTYIETEEYTATVEWNPQVATDGAFAKKTIYTATITVTPKQNYTVRGIAVNEYTLDGATTVTNEANSNIVTAVFPQTAGSSSSGGSGAGTLGYAITFETNGGSKVASMRVTNNAVIKEPTAPTKDGYDFAGWYTDKELETKYDFSQKVTKAFTLYAKWTEKDNKDNSENQIILTIGEKTAKVFGKTKTNDVAPKIVNNRTMLPSRFVAENLGAEVVWDGDKELVTIMGKNLKTGEDVTILITIGAESATVNGEDVKLDASAFIENDRTYTPIRFISEHLGASVEWSENEQKVIITK